MHPRLFATLLLIDPVVSRRPLRLLNAQLSRASSRRKDRWPNRKAARDALQKTKFFQTWNPRVLDRWISHGLRPLPTAIYPSMSPDPSDPEVTLSTTRHQEVFSFLRPNFVSSDNPLPMTNPNRTTLPDVDTTILEANTPFYRPETGMTFSRLPFVRPSVFYIFAENSYLCSADAMEDKMETTGTGVGGSGGAKHGRVRRIIMKGAGHLMPMENVKETAEACAGWLVPEVDRWARLEERERQQWAAVRNKSQFSDEYLRMLESDWGEISQEEYAKVKL